MIFCFRILINSHSLLSSISLTTNYDTIIHEYPGICIMNILFGVENNVETKIIN